ncbi:PhnD/SsuA/transferrin family substrate-binding protein [Alkalimarinus coralli]|uniref:PhnD/SsuA/transferrin family substrate-binding protein n=1 Tax=Alkalimarinus coralli TaxID=2935863 RepID=UPI00202B0A4E|nr:PhnD/SsuA/transferrin family substrate-binding protein [Alkalimarinus coralli]
MFSTIRLKISRLRYKAAACALLALLLAALPSVGLSQDSLTIYFYNPEINTTRNVVLKTAFDQYLQEQGIFQFQPVDNRQTFEALIVNDLNAVFMISNWHYEQLQDGLNPTSAALRGVKNGSNTYRKFLVARKADATIEAMTIATSGSRPLSRSILSDIYPNQTPQTLAKPNFLIVPKDIDALMAVGFGLADAALATELSLETLSTLYTNQYQQLHILGESRPLKRLLVVYHKELTPLKAKAINTLGNMSESRKGKQALNILGLNGWQQVDKKPNKDGRPKQ